MSTKCCGLKPPGRVWLLLWVVVGSLRCGGVGGLGASAAGITGNPPNVATSLRNLGRL